MRCREMLCCIEIWWSRDKAKITAQLRCAITRVEEPFNAEMQSFKLTYVTVRSLLSGRTWR